MSDTTWHEVVVDGLTYRFRDKATGERFRLAVEEQSVGTENARVADDGTLLGARLIGRRVL